MDMDRDKIMERILHLTLEILFRLTGEDYTVVKKTSSERCQAPVSEGWGRPLSPITGPPPHPPIHEDINDQKILELTYKMIELLTGEVPIRCQDVTVYFSLEEWEYLEGHKDLYKDVMIEDLQPLTSPGLSSKRTTPERCPRPLLPQDCKQEDPDVPQDHQGEDLIHINTTETYVRGDERSKEEIPTDDRPDNNFWRPEGYQTSSAFEAGDREITHDTYEEPAIIPYIHSKDLSSDPFKSISKISHPLSGDLLYKRVLLIQPLRMDMDRDKMAERILQLLLEILYRLTGEDYTVVKKASSERCQAPVSEGWGRPLSPITGPPPHPPIHEDINDQKILELTYKMIELLTGEVPIRCQDVTVYFSMEEWEYLEGHKDLYKDVMMEVPQPLTSPVLSSKRTTPERCPRPLLPQDCKQEDPDVPQDHQGEDLTHINTTETYVRGDEWCKEETPTYDYPADDYSWCPQEHQISSDFKIVKQNERFHIGIEQYSCSQCGKYFNHESDLVTHQRTHRAEKLYSCSECGKCFNYESNLSRHQQIHKAEKPYSCSECGKCFNRKSVLVEHQRIHTGEKPYACSECGKCFNYESNLSRHQRIHTTEKPYSCSQCGKCFNYESNLSRHQQIHTGEKPYSCSVCEKCFSQKSVLFRHHILHTGEKPFSCSHCDKSFKRKADVVAHQRSHTGEKPFSCSECGKCFTRKAHLVKHQRIHTGEKQY
ncbi:uncharacterized protein LOC142312469 [Anomaloglossus baeobatrachus]|uniref:uncharacterized protein LOC142312469 n=1 Tax=Anomaloglossus baeobatrachus TaxID=238106 RepID=UPI003F5071FE